MGHVAYGHNRISIIIDNRIFGIKIGEKSINVYNVLSPRKTIRIYIHRFILLLQGVQIPTRIIRVYIVIIEYHSRTSVQNFMYLRV